MNKAEALAEPYENTGGAAFPGELMRDGVKVGGLGMTLRDYFAIRCWQTLAAIELCLPDEKRQHADIDLAILAYAYAEDMLEARKPDDIASPAANEQGSAK